MLLPELLVLATGIVGDAVKPGDVVQLTGCEDLGNGPELVVPKVNVWALPGGGLVPGQSLRGELPAGSAKGTAATRCHGSAVVVQEVRSIDGRVFMKVQAVHSPLSGWMTASFAGRRFDRSKCDSVYGHDAAALARCKGK